MLKVKFLRVQRLVDVIIDYRANPIAITAAGSFVIKLKEDRNQSVYLKGSKLKGCLLLRMTYLIIDNPNELNYF